MRISPPVRAPSLDRIAIVPLEGAGKTAKAIDDRARRGERDIRSSAARRRGRRNMVMTESNGDIGARLAHYRALFDLTGKTAVVLGAASGIGKASAEALAALGASVICADKDRAGVERTAAELGRHVRTEAHVVDAGSAEDIAALAAAAKAGTID